MTDEYTQFECTEQIVDGAPDAAIVANLGTASKILASVEDRDLNFYMKGAMGSTTPVANGLAMQVDRDVVAIEGDGGLIMQLGGLATVSRNNPGNLTVVVMNNRTFTTTGGQSSLSSAVDLRDVAAGCNLDAYHAAGPEAFAEAFGAAVESDDAAVVVADVVSTQPEEHPDIDYPHSYQKHRFRQAVTGDD
jgi:sulfopyruvate decarboxylase subunit beta